MSLCGYGKDSGFILLVCGMTCLLVVSFELEHDKAAAIGTLLVGDSAQLEVNGF